MEVPNVQDVSRDGVLTIGSGRKSRIAGEELVFFGKFSGSFMLYLRNIFSISLATTLLSLVGILGFVSNVDENGNRQGAAILEPEKYRNVTVVPIRMSKFGEVRHALMSSTEILLVTLDGHAAAYFLMLSIQSPMRLAFLVTVFH